MAPDERTTNRLLPIIQENLRDEVIDVVVVHEHSWDSVVVDVNDRWIFKFPRDADAANRLRLEARLLDLVADRLTLSVPKNVGL